LPRRTLTLPAPLLLLLEQAKSSQPSWSKSAATIPTGRDPTVKSLRANVPSPLPSQTLTVFVPVP